MSAIEEICLPPAWRTSDLWPFVASQTHRWLQRQGLIARDAIVLLPFAALLAPARQAFADLGGWQVRVETPLTLATSLGPPPAEAPGQCTGNTILDRLSARALMDRHDWARTLAAGDPAGFDRIVSAVVSAAQALRAAAFERQPAARPAFWDRARASLAAPAGPAAAEALLLQLALEWAAQAAAPPTDSLWAASPTAWVVLQIGGADPVVEGLLADSSVPVLRLNSDPSASDPFADVCARSGVRRVICEDFESEAQAATAQVIEALNAGQEPVALVALDRALVRRVRALLERQHVPLVDETGWVLATTRAAASVVGLLHAAQASASQDTVLAWLKDWPAAEPRALESLEAMWRGRRHVPDKLAAEQLWRLAQAHLARLGNVGSLPLVRWLGLLHEVLSRDGSLERLTADAAGAQVLMALHLQGGGGAGWQHAASQARMNLGGLIAWAQAALEESPYLPTPDAGAAVVLTPLARAFGRPFGHIVVPASDHRHLGRVDSPPSLVADAWAADLGMDHAAARRQRQLTALAHVMRAQRVTFLRRHRNADEPLAESPAVDWLLLMRARLDLPPWPLEAWQPASIAATVRPVPRPQPVAARALPEWLSATQLEALRACPYRFFARAVLRLEEPEELDAGLAKRDYGNWLHAVLHHFHSQRDFTTSTPAQLQAAADFVTQQLGLDEGEMLPWRASFESFAPAYLSWSAEREARGWYWADGESDHRRLPPELGGLGLRGRIDRLDHGPDDQQQLLDYKTGSVEALKKKLRDPLEDTQLAFYAALMGDTTTLSAAYVALDTPEAPLLLVHEEVQKTAATLLHNLGQEWQRLAAGASMPALGEGTVCDTCEVRGLCRRDHWAAP